MTEQPCVWVILYEKGPGYSWTDLAFWGAAETYEAALKKLTKAVGPPNATSRSSLDHDVHVYRKGQTWRIRKVLL